MKQFPTHINNDDSNESNIQNDSEKKIIITQKKKLKSLQKYITLGRLCVIFRPCPETQLEALFAYYPSKIGKTNSKDRLFDCDIKNFF